MIQLLASKFIPDSIWTAPQTNRQMATTRRRMRAERRARQEQMRKCLERIRWEIEASLARGEAQEETVRVQ